MHLTMSAAHYHRTFHLAMTTDRPAAWTGCGRSHAKDPTWVSKAEATSTLPPLPITVLAKASCFTSNGVAECGLMDCYGARVRNLLKGESA